MRKIPSLLAIIILAASCCAPSSNEPVDQFYLPKNSISPKGYWRVVHSDFFHKEDPAFNEAPGDGLQGYLLMHSGVGLINKAAIEGKIEYCAWMDQSGLAYDTERALLGPEIAAQTALELATLDYGEWEGINVQPKDLFKGYVLTDLKNNPESGNIAAVASHVYDALIADVANEQFFIDAGYSLKCDCSKMTLKQAFDTFKDKCSNETLVLMPVGIPGQLLPAGEFRDYAIANRLFVANIKGGLADNSMVFNEILDWLTPGAIVLGWENNRLIQEMQITDPISKRGHMILPADWSYNHALTSHDYVARQPSTKAKTINPADIDYSQEGKFISFFLTDGDSYQFNITDPYHDAYYNIPSSATTKTAFELGTQSLIQLAPTRFTYLIEHQPSPECTIMETFGGGGYYYIDTFATEGKASKDRKALLRKVAERTAAHMRSHGIKVLHVMAKDFSSRKGKEMIQAFVDANDELEGITGVEYAPYTGGKGKIYWYTNKAGYDIPFITTKYMLWEGQCSPAQAAQKANEESPDFSTVVIHAWSEFDGKKAADAAEMMINELDSSFRVVSVEELIWRVRMAKRERQTKKYLSTIE